MTKDTERALAAIKPMAEALDIEVRATDCELICNEDVHIGIACNSTWATIMEFVGYVFLHEYIRRFRPFKQDGIREIIKRYWLPSSAGQAEGK